MCLQLFNCRSWRSSFFNWFYFCVNLGSLVATTVVVGVQENRGYGLGFAIPTIFFAAAILAFVLGAVFKLYIRIPPEGSPFTRVLRVLKGMFSVVWICCIIVDCQVINLRVELLVN